MAQHSTLAQRVILTNFFNAIQDNNNNNININRIDSTSDSDPEPSHADSTTTPTTTDHDEPDSLMPPPKTVVGRALGSECALGGSQNAATHAGAGTTLSDTPISTAPPSPQINPKSYTSGASTPGKTRATTLDIPGLTKSKVSPDGRIAQRDVGSKLVIVMVGLPARGKSYITKKLSRYLNWLQHDTKIFNVGERRRVAAGGGTPEDHKGHNHPREHRQEQEHQHKTVPEIQVNGASEAESDRESTAEVENQLRESVREVVDHKSSEHKEVQAQVEATLSIPASRILLNGQELEDHRNVMQTASPMTDIGATPAEGVSRVTSPEHSHENGETTKEAPLDTEEHEKMDQSAVFFDPNNERASQIRERLALETLDELLDYILEQGGSVGILDATNSTIKRRKAVMEHIRARAGTALNILFVESQCLDQNLLESNMLLKLSGPDYKNMDPVVALTDFKKRVKLYEKSYVPLGEYEEANNIPYVKTIDVCRKVVSFEVNGFLSSQVVYYLLNFNLSARQIWISRHGESLDDVAGRIGGDSPLSKNGVRYAQALSNFIEFRRSMWELARITKAQSSHFPPRPGDSTPPNPQRSFAGTEPPRNFCVWTSMMKRSIQTAQFFNEDRYDIKEMRMLDELNAGKMEGMTYQEIREKYPEDYAARRRQKLHYRYPGVGGEGYLDVINRLRAVIVEVERTTDHVLLIGHRSVARILLAYFLGLKRDILTDLDVPLGTIYALEPKPYGVELQVFKYNPNTEWFDEIPNYELKHETYY